MMEKAQLRCQKCKHEWEQDPKPAQCPKCGHVYLTWLNHPLVIARANTPQFYDNIKLIDKLIDEVENG